MPKIPSSTIIREGVRVLTDLYAEIDKQVGGEQRTRDDKVSDAEIAVFLRQRGARSETAGAAVATVQAYLRHFTSGGEVSLDDIRKTLQKVTGYLERDRDAGKEIAEIKPTWRAVALFAQEVKAKGLTAREIVADRSRVPIGDLAVIAPALDLMGQVLREIGTAWGGGTLSQDALRSYLATGPDTVASAKEAARLLVRYLEHRTGKQQISAAEVDAALKTARTALEKNAAGADDRAQLAPTWRALLAFADENAVRQKDARAIVGAPAPRSTPRSTPAGACAADLAAFQRLETGVKLEILEDYGDLHGHYQTTGEKRIGELAGPPREYAEKMRKELLSIVGDFEDDSCVYGTIGGPETYVEVISLPNGEIVGGRIWLSQHGFDAENAPVDDNGDTPYHFDTAAECAAAGINPDEDISWQVHGLFETISGGGISPLGGGYEHVSDYWEWGGY